MKLTLDEAEIKAAIIAYAHSCIQIADGTDISVDILAGRTNGFSATLDITPAPMKAKTPVYRQGTATPIEDPAQPEVLTQAVVREPVSEGTVVTPIAVAEPAAKPVAAMAAMAGIFGKKADTVIVDEVAPVAEPVYSTDADAIPDAPAEEAAKPAVKSIFSKAS